MLRSKSWSEHRAARSQAEGIPARNPQTRAVETGRLCFGLRRPFVLQQRRKRNCRTHRLHSLDRRQFPREGKREVQSSSINLSAPSATANHPQNKKGGPELGKPNPPARLIRIVKSVSQAM